MTSRANYCSKCGTKFVDIDKFCTDCGNPRALNDTSVQNKKLRRFSWGAFGLGWIYFWQMKYSKWGWIFLIQILLIGISGVEEGGLVALALATDFGVRLVFGFKGYELALKHRKWRSDEDFLATQTKWNYWGASIYTLLIVVGFLIY